MLNSILINNKSKVNTFNEDILEISNIQDKENKLTNDFLNLVPKIHKSTVINLVQKQFKGNFEEYIKTIPLFFNPLIWNKKKTDETDEKFLSNKTNRQKKINKKKLILHSAQLLKLIGFHRQTVATKGMVKEYVEDMENSDNYIKSLRLINSKGSIIPLETYEQKQRNELAYRLKVCDTLDLIATRKGFTNSLITFTLPPFLHSNPKNGNCSYQGATPEQAKQTIFKYWKLFRARLSNLGLYFGEDVLGLQVIECQNDSTLHLHSVLYCSIKNMELVEQALMALQNRENKKTTNKKEQVKFDFKKSDPNNENFRRGSSYLMKYLNKTHTVYNDIENERNDEALKNQATRWFYGIRGFNFYGLKGSITKFNTLIKNHHSYKALLSDEINIVLKNADLFTFITEYEKFFDTVYQKTDGENKKSIGVIFSKGLYRKQVRQNKKDKNKQRILLIGKVENELKKLEERLIKVKEEDTTKRLNLIHRIANKEKLLDGLFLTNTKSDIEIKKQLGNSDFVLIERKFFSIFQSCLKTEQAKHIDTLENLENLPNVLTAYETVTDKQNEFDKYVSNFKNNDLSFFQSLRKYNESFILKLEDYKLNNKLDEINFTTLKDIEEIKENYINPLKSNTVQLIKGIQGKVFNHDEREKIKEKALNEVNLSQTEEENRTKEQLLELCS